MGKTFVTIERITNEINSDEEFGRSIHLVYTMNTLLSGKQFSKRLQVIEAKYGKGSVVIFASKYDGCLFKHVKNVVELKGLCMDARTRPRIVVMCSNDYRFNDGVEFITCLNDNLNDIQRVYVYFDELHSYINDKLREQIQEIHTLDIVKGMIALTATPMNIYKKTGFWSKIPMIDLDEFNDTNYAGYKDMKFTNIDNFFSNPYIRPPLFAFDELDRQTLEYIKHVLVKYPHILKEKSKVFIPAHIRRNGHEKVRDLVFELNNNAIVVVLNGKEKTLSYMDENKCIIKIPLVVKNKKELQLITNNKHLINNDEEICKIIADVINDKDNHLENKPLVITGFLCVGMGQTLTHKSLGSFTSAILGHMDLTNDQIYQLFGRITGRMKDWGDKYIKTHVYCPTIIMNRCFTMEECARNIAIEYNGETTTDDDYMKTMLDMGITGKDALDNLRKGKEDKPKRPKRPTPENYPIPFPTIEEVNKFLTNIYKKPINIKGFYKPDIYEVSTRLVAYYKKKKDQLKDSDRLTEEFYKNIPIGMNISTREGHGQQYMVYPVYKDKDSLPIEVKYYVRYLKPNNVMQNEVI